jgi:hypothetical protein
VELAGPHDLLVRAALAEDADSCVAADVIGQRIVEIGRALWMHFHMRTERERFGESANRGNV